MQECYSLPGNFGRAPEQSRLPYQLTKDIIRKLAGIARSGMKLVRFRSVFQSWVGGRIAGSGGPFGVVRVEEELVAPEQGTKTFRRDHNET